MSVEGVSALTTNAIGAVKGLTARHAYIQDNSTKHTINRIDASIREIHSIESTPSKFPIESGQAVTDNFVVEPQGLEMEGFITDNPINPVATAVTSVVSALVPPSGLIAGGVAVAVFNALNSSKSPSAQNFNQFVQLIVNKTCVNVYTTLFFYQSMWLSSLRVTRDAKNGSSLQFNARFVRVILVQPYTVNVAKYASQNSAPQASRGKISNEFANLAAASYQNGMVTSITQANSLANTAGLPQAP